MSTPEHRRGAGSRVDPRLLLVAAFLLGALVSGAVVAVLASGSGGSGAEPTTVAHTGSPSPSAGDEPSTAAPPSSQAPVGGDPEQWALMTQPLAQLQPGDRVVYNMITCHFRAWVGDGTDVALIACPGDQPFQTQIENLVPVEPAQGD
jgi:hypothetical protein